jgi:hypothetical protein
MGQCETKDNYSYIGAQSVNSARQSLFVRKSVRILSEAVSSPHIDHHRMGHQPTFSTTTVTTTTTTTQIFNFGMGKHFNAHETITYSLTEMFFPTFLRYLLLVNVRKYADAVSTNFLEFEIILEIIFCCRL